MTTDGEAMRTALREMIELMEKAGTSMGTAVSSAGASMEAFRKAEMASREAAGSGSGDGMKEFLSKKGRLFPPAAQYRGAGIRPAFSSRDLTDATHDGDLEEWLAEQLHDWELLSQSAMLNGLAGLLEKEITNAHNSLDTVRGADLRAEGYHEGQINALETVLDMVSRAARSRDGKVGMGL